MVLRNVADRGGGRLDPIPWQPGEGSSARTTLHSRDERPPGGAAVGARARLRSAAPDNAPDGPSGPTGRVADDVGVRAAGRASPRRHRRMAGEPAARGPAARAG